MSAGGHAAHGTTLVPLGGDEVRSVLLEVLDDVDRFCREHGIRYYLYAGTLLGAVRHHGFIPWDDDVDVMMPRPDYVRFCSLFADSDRYRLITRDRHPTYPYASAKVSRVGTLVVEEVDIAEHDRFGISVDVLPFDAVSDRRWIFRGHMLTAWVVRAILLTKVVQPTESRSMRTRLMLRLTRALFKPIRVSWLTSARQSLARAWGDRGSHHCSMLVASVPWRVPNDWVEPPSEVEFEGRRFPAPADTHRFLAAVYGDYLSPPAPGSQVSPHLATAYRVLDTPEEETW